MLRIPHYVDNRVTEGGKVFIHTNQPRYTLHKHYFSLSGPHFCYRLSKPQGLVGSEGLGKLKHSALITTLPRKYE
jgi:hypothetical protein